MPNDGLKRDGIYDIYMTTVLLIPLIIAINYNLKLKKLIDKRKKNSVIKGGVFSEVKVKSRHDHDFRRTANV